MYRELILKKLRTVDCIESSTVLRPENSMLIVELNAVLSTEMYTEWLIRCINTNTMLTVEYNVDYRTLT